MAHVRSQSRRRRFSPLTQLTPENVGGLKIAWTYHMRPAGFPGGRGGFPTMEGRRPGGAVGDTPDVPDSRGRGAGRGRFGSGFRPSEVTPLVINGMMYLSTPYSRVVAVDPTTGKEVWAFQLPSGNPSTRGVEYWPGDAADAGADRLRFERRQAVFAGREDRQAERGASAITASSI